MVIDSHCHLDLIDLDKVGKSLDQIIQDAKDIGVHRILCVSVKPEQFQSMNNITSKFGNYVDLSVGLHPSEIAQSNWKEVLEENLADARVVAVGETGLDYHWDTVSKEEQLDRFSWQINLALNKDLPLIVHTREAKDDTVALLRDEGKSKVTGVMHCFTETVEMAKQCLDLGFYVSLSGIVTFKNAKQVQDVARYVPMDRLLVETDSPYLAPIPNRGRVNVPANVIHTAKFVADLKSIDISEFINATTDNYFNLFGRQ